MSENESNSDAQTEAEEIRAINGGIEQFNEGDEIITTVHGDWDKQPREVVEVDEEHELLVVESSRGTIYHIDVDSTANKWMTPDAGTFRIKRVSEADGENGGESVTTADELEALEEGDVVTYATEDNLEWEVRDVRVTNPDEHPHHSVSVALYEVGGTRDRKIKWDSEDGAEIVDPSKKTGTEVAKNLEEAEKENPDTTRVYLGGELFRVEGTLAELDVEVQSDRGEEEPELVTDGGQPVGRENIPTPDYDLSIVTTDRDRATGVEYLSIVEDEARVTHIADDYDVRVDDLTRIIFALGARLDHSVHDEEDVIYDGDGYTVTVAAAHRQVVEETISREISDEHALEAEREMAEQYDVDPDSVEDEKAIAHYRDQLTLAVLRAMGDLDDNNSGYPVGYPLVILDEGDLA